MKSITCLCLCAFLFNCSIFAANNNIKLPKPNLKSNTSIMSALSNRKSCRSYSTKNISTQTLSDLLWAASGINRPDGKRTAPSAMNTQNITIYAAMKNGVYKYDAKNNILTKILNKDIKAQIGHQKFLETVPIDLIFVADLSNSKVTDKDQMFYSALNTGYISQNVYLFCAANSLGTVAVGWVQRDKLLKTLTLNKNQHIILAQPVGYPK